MYSLSCKDMGMPQCDYVATGETMEEAMKKSTDHGMETHGDTMKEMSNKMTPEQMTEMMKSKIKHV